MSSLENSIKEEMPTLLKDTKSWKGRNTYKIILWLSIALIPKPDKDTRRKLQANIPDEHRCKILIKILANQIQQHIKIIIHHDQLEFIPEMQR